MSEKRNVAITLETAKEWYKAGGDLRQVALQAFNEKELKPASYKNIKSIDDAIKALNLCPIDVQVTIDSLKDIDAQLAYQLILKLILKAVNGEDWCANQQDTVYVPWLYSYASKEEAINWVKGDIENRKYIGEYFANDKTRYLAGGDFYSSDSIFSPRYSGYSGRFGLGAYVAGVSLLGCKSAEIATHVSKYFGNIIMNAIHFEQFHYLKEK